MTYRLILGIIFGSRLMAHGREGPARPPGPNEPRAPPRDAGPALLPFSAMSHEQGAEYNAKN